MDVRPYQPKDRTACLAILNSLVPRLISPASKPRFETFLDNITDPFFVMEHDDSIIGCGGYAIPPNSDTAELKWGMVRDDLRKTGLGRFLLLYRIREIAKTNGIAMVTVETPPASAPFFDKQGFHRLNSDEETVRLTKRLTVCA